MLANVANELPCCRKLPHSSIFVGCIRSMESTLIKTSVEIRKTVQDCWVGRGNSALKRVSYSESDVQYHLGSLPNDRDGMSVILFLRPGMCSGVSGETCLSFRRNASTHTSFDATTDPLAAMQHTQCTVGELSLNSATCAPSLKPHTSSITSHSNSRPAISK
jgi:hypothetical protein